MKLFLSLIILLGGFVYTPPKVNNFRLKNLDNRTTSYKDIKGEQFTVIDFWATWCKPCIKSIPKLVEISEEFEDQGVNFVGISIDGPRNLAKVKPFARSLGVTYPILLDTNSEVMGKLGVRAVPSLLIINSDDEIVYFHEGYKPGEEIAIREEILKLLGE
ncbi:MAG: TlpA family protein disulfide reductase [Balneolaceae bacterium]|nr:TlpA family protein disulfide reductase [Balneolaceae bacterium]MBO6545026.1 TlpA family protein disulfide reductase [Balneolaceae bacterium]MBO6646422.1 TlpA family protein disulfide reductase [Balneolaceae bacterium]